MNVSSKFDPETRIFANDFLESLTRTHPAGPAVFWIPMSIACCVFAVWKGLNPLFLPLCVVAGAFGWTFFEYWIHRTVFHWIPSSSKVRRYFYLAHQVHHDKAENDRLVMPVPGAIMLGTPIFLALYFAFGETFGVAAFAGVVIGYLAYDYVHYFSHFGKPKSRYMKRVRRRHAQHHHGYPNAWYGLSNHFWDHVFGTTVKKGMKPKAYPGAGVDWARPDFEVVEN